MQVRTRPIRDNDCGLDLRMQPAVLQSNCFSLTVSWPSAYGLVPKARDDHRGAATVLPQRSITITPRSPRVYEVQPRIEGKNGRLLELLVGYDGEEGAIHTRS